MLSFYCPPGILLQALDRCSGIVKKSAREYTSLVLLDVHGDHLNITASDAIVTVKNTVPIHGVEGDLDSLCVDYGAFRNWISYSFIADRDIRFEFNGKELKAEVKKNRNSTFAYIPSHKFLNVFDLKTDEIITSIDGKLFKDMVGSVGSLADPEQYTVLKNTLMIFRENIVEIIATDSFIFGYYNGTQRGEARDEIVIDSRALLSISSAIQNFDTINVHKRIREASNLIFFSSNNCYVYTPVRDEKYPDVKPFFAEDNSSKALINKDELIRALKASKGFTTSDNRRPVFIEINPEDTSIIISAEKTELGQNVDIIGASKTIGRNISVKANIDYLITAISRIEGLKLWIHLDRDEKNVPKNIHITDLDGRQKFIIAPMR